MVPPLQSHELPYPDLLVVAGARQRPDADQHRLGRVRLLDRDAAELALPDRFKLVPAPVIPLALRRPADADDLTPRLRRDVLTRHPAPVEKRARFHRQTVQKMDGR